MAAGSGLSAAADNAGIKSSIALGAGGWSGTGFNWVALSTTQGTLASKAGFTEWLTASDTSYARQAMGAAGVGWTFTTWSASGSEIANTNAINFPAVATTAQTLFAVMICDTIGPTGGNIGWFADLASSSGVGIGIIVSFNALTDITFFLN